MALLLREADVERFLDMSTALQAVEEALGQHGLGQASNQPRRRIYRCRGGVTHWDRMHELGEIVCGKVPGRKRPDEVTLFKSNGLAIEDVAVAQKVLERARTEGVGIEVPLFM